LYDFDDYDGWKETITNSMGDFEVSVEVFYIDKSTNLKTTSKSTLKKMEVSVQNKFLVESNSNQLKRTNSA
jgi:hypothetical protein